MNISVKASGSPAEIAALLRTLADKIETSSSEMQSPVELHAGEAALVAEPKKRMKISPSKPRSPRVKLSPINRAMKLATDLDAELRKAHDEVSGPAQIVLFDLIEPACRIKQRLEWLAESMP